MNLLRAVQFSLVLVLSLAGHKTYGAHPLITEDTGTQGLGKFQLELTNEHAYDRDGDGAETHAVYSGITLSAGMLEHLDVMVTAPHLRYSIKTPDESIYESGWTDIAVDLKWRFYEIDEVSFAVKPGVTLPTGDSDHDLGSGKNTYSAFIVASYEPAPWAFHLHVGYIHNRNVLNQRQDLRHLSIAAAFDAAEKLKLVADVGVDTNTDDEAESHPAFLIAGAIYSLYPSLDLDVGYKSALSASHVDRAYLAGLALRF